jgi:Antibiotic biosynthesis monooxygenase
VTERPATDRPGEVVRVWKGYGSADGVARYCREHFAGTLLPQLRSLEGFRGAKLLVRDAEAETEVVVATVWESLAAVEAFAGESLGRAVVEPVVAGLLVRWDDTVTHFRVVLSEREA